MRQLRARDRGPSATALSSENRRMPERDMEQWPRAERPRPAASCSCACHLGGRGARRRADHGCRRRRGHCRRGHVHRARKRGAGVRHRPRARRDDVADRSEREDGRHPEGRLARWAAVPERAAGQRLPRALEGATAASRVRSRCTPTRRRRGIRASTTSRFPTTATPTSPPATGRSSPSTCTRRRARRASPVCRRPAGSARTAEPPGLPPLPPLDATSRAHSVPFVPPYPTLIEYSGYGYADPAGPVNGIAVLANLMGFAVVDVNMRGTGCSGGAFDFFEPLQSLDGVRRDRDDRPPTVGARSQGRDDGHLLRRDQPAVHGAARSARPRGDLTAVDDRRDRDDALSRRRSSTPASRSRGRSSARRRPSPPGRTAVSRGRTSRSRGRHDVRGQPGAARRGGRPDAEDRGQRALRPDGRRSARPDHVRQQDQGAGVHGLPVGGRADGRTLPRSRPALHRHDAEVVHLHQRRAHRLARSGHLRPLVRLPGAVRRPPGADRERGGHPGRRAGHLPGGDGASRRPTSVTLPADPIQLEPTYEAALAAFEQLPEVRVLFDNGAGASPTGSSTAGDPYPGFEQSFSTFPIPGTTARTWYLGAGGSAAEPAAGAQGHQLVHVEREGPAAHRLSEQHRVRAGCGATRRSGNGTGSRTRRAPRSRTSRRRSRSNTTVIGGGAVHLWVRSSTPDVDLQATISEVRPDGNETFVQNGWIRAERAQARRRPRTTCSSSRARLLEPIPSMRGGRRLRRCRPASSSRSSSRSTTRATRTAPGRGSE